MSVDIKKLVMTNTTFSFFSKSFYFVSKPRLTFTHCAGFGLNVILKNRLFFQFAKHLQLLCKISTSKYHVVLRNFFSFMEKNNFVFLWAFILYIFCFLQQIMRLLDHRNLSLLVYPL